MAEPSARTAMEAGGQKVPTPRQDPRLNALRFKVQPVSTRRFNPLRRSVMDFGGAGYQRLDVVEIVVVPGALKEFFLGGFVGVDLEDADDIRVFVVVAVIVEFVVGVFERAGLDVLFPDAPYIVPLPG